MQQPLTAYYLDNDNDSEDKRIRSRSVSDVVLTGKVDVPAPPVRLLLDWEREMQHMVLEAGDVEALPLARTRMRWPEYATCVRAVTDWARTVGLHDVLTESDIALMACRGARYHHDAKHYGRSAFCNLFLSENKGLDLHFPSAGLRIPLIKGTVVVFDTAQPHAVIWSGSSSFKVSDFPTELDCSQVFLTWELPITHPRIAQALGISFDIVPTESPLCEDGLVWLNGMKANVCPESGQWLAES